MLSAVILSWTGGQPLEERVVSLRMLLFFGSALIAFITPYLLFPDPASTLLQLGNVSKEGILRHLAGRLNLFWTSALFSIALVCFGDLQYPLSNLQVKLFYFCMGSIFFSGLMAIAFSRYTQVGMQSQFWKESEKGKQLRSRVADYFKYPLDPGSIPSLINTIIIGAGGMILVSAGSLLYGSFGQFYELLPALILAGAGIIMLRKLKRSIVTHYYASNAFFNEFFGETIEGKEQAELQAIQLWWVPAPVKSHVWALLLQLDRKLPAGRVLAAGHLLIWVLSYRDPSEQVMISAWVFFALFHHWLIIVSLSDRFAPGWFRRWIGTSWQWIVVRAWMQFRWILLLATSMLFNSWIFGHVAYSAQVFILAGYALSAFIISAAATYYQSTTTEPS